MLDRFAEVVGPGAFLTGDAIPEDVSTTNR